MKENDAVFDRKIWALLSGYLHDPEEVKEVAQVLNDEFVPRVMGVLKKCGVDETTCEEIAKEAVDKAAKAYQPGRAKFLTFVTKIALNIRIDRYRQGLLPSQTPHSLDDDTLKLQETLADSPGTVDPPGKSKFIRDVNSVVPLLSQEDRILIQFDIQDVPSESYKQLYGLSETAYRKRKSRAYERLRDLYNNRHSQ